MWQDNVAWSCLEKRVIDPLSQRPTTPPCHMSAAPSHYVPRSSVTKLAANLIGNIIAWLVCRPYYESLYNSVTLKM